VGSVLGSFAGLLTSYNKLFKAAGKSGQFVGMPAPQGPTGVRSMMGGHMELDPACGAAITSKSKYPAEITRMMDYFYNDDGRLLLYFGVAGDTFNMVSGKPVYTDKVAKHPSLAIAQYLNTYVGYISQWPSIVPGEHQLALYDQEGRDALPISAKTMGDRKIPILQFSAAELKEAQTMLRDINTYVDEWVNAFIRGQKPMSDWSAFQDGLKKLNTERLTVIYQTAYSRYQKAAGI
jgi:putative aldouronate transport system substrate-binding protein